jgi:hypothetical protein
MGWLARTFGLKTDRAGEEAVQYRDESAEALDRARSSDGLERVEAIDDASWSATQARWAADDARTAADDALLELQSQPDPSIDDQLTLDALESAAFDAELAADEAEWDAWEAEDLD